MPILILGRRAPRMPPGLPTRLQTIYREICNQWATAGVLDEADGGIILAQATAKWMILEQLALLKLSPTGILNVNSQGLVTHPAAHGLLEWVKEYRQLSAGTINSPWGRARLNIHGSSPGGRTIEDDLGPARPPLRAVPG
jgi:hypothetical protein